jgi:hypothetical protein
MEKIFENGKKKIIKMENMYKIKIGGHIACPFSRRGQGGLCRVVLCLNSGLALLCCPNYKLLLLLCCCCPNYKLPLNFNILLLACRYVSHQLFFYLQCRYLIPFTFYKNFYIRVLCFFLKN